TDAEAAILFERLGAKALVFAGAHRCADTTPSGCHSTKQCSSSGVPFTSDLAHATTNALNAVHLAFRSTEAIEVQLHTNFKQLLNGDALVSNGTHNPIPGTVAD